MTSTSKYPLASQCYQIGSNCTQYSESAHKELYLEQIHYTKYPLFVKKKTNGQTIVSLWPDDPSLSLNSDNYMYQEMFEKQFEQLLMKLYFWGQENINNINLTPIETFNNQLFEVNNNKEFVYAVNQSASYFESLKGMLETIQLFLNDVNQPIFKRIKVFKELCPNLNVCAPGVFEHISETYNKVNIIEQPSSWLMQLRASIIRRYASEHKLRNDIHSGDEIHVDSVLFKYAQDLNWQPSIAKIDELNDIFANTARLSVDDISEFHNFFDHEYSLKAILETLNSRLIEQLSNIKNKLCSRLKNNMQISRHDAVQYIDEISSKLEGLGLISSKIEIRKLFNVNESTYEIIFIESKQLQLIKSIAFDYCLKQSFFDKSKLKQISFKSAEKNFRLLYLENGYWSLVTLDASIKINSDNQLNKNIYNQLIKIMLSFNISLWGEFVKDIKSNANISLNIGFEIAKLIKSNKLYCHINSAKDFKILMREPMPGKKNIIFPLIKNKMPSFIYSINDIIDVFNFLTPQQSLIVFNSLALPITNIIKSTNNLYYLLDNLNAQARPTVFRLLADILEPLLQSSYDIEAILFLVKEQQKDFLFEVIKKNHNSLIGCGDDFARLLKHLNLSQRKDLFDLVKNDLPDNITTFFDYIAAQYYLEYEQSIVLMLGIKSKLPSLIISTENLSKGIYYLSGQNLIKVLEILNDELIQRIKTPLQLISFLNNVKPEQFQFILRNQYLKNIIDSADDFQLLIKEFNINQRQSAFEAYEEKINQWLQSPLDFAKLSHNLNQLQTTSLFLSNKNMLIEKITCYRTCAQVCVFLNETQYQEVLQAISLKFHDVFKITSDFNHFLQYIDSDRCQKTCEYFKEQLITKINNENGYSYLYLFEDLSDDKCRAVCKGIDLAQAHIINTSNDFNNLLSGLLPLQRTIIYEEFKDNLVHLFKGGHCFKQILNHLNMAQRCEMFNSFKSFFNEYITSGLDLKNILFYLTFKQKAEAFDGAKKNLSLYLNNGQDLKNIYSCVHKDSHDQLYEYLKNNINKIIKTSDDFYCVINAVKDEQRVEIINLIDKSNLSKIIKSSPDFAKDLCSLKLSSSYPEILSLILPELDNILSNINDCYYLLSSLPKTQRNVLFEIIVDKGILSNLKVNSVVDFENLYMLININNKVVLFDTFKTKLLDRINSINDLIKITNLLTGEQTLKVINLLSNKIPGFIKDIDDLNSVIMNYTANDFRLIIGLLQNNIHKIIKSSSDFHNVYYFLLGLVSNRDEIFINLAKNNLELIKMMAKEFVLEIIEPFPGQFNSKKSPEIYLQRIEKADCINDIKEFLDYFINKTSQSSTSNHKYFKSINTRASYINIVLSENKSYIDLFKAVGVLIASIRSEESMSLIKDNFQL